MNTFSEQLRAWAENTADFYHNIATRDIACNLAFYTQSDLSRIDHSPELLILAINPGSCCSYEDQIKNPKWNLTERMSGEKLLAGNPWYANRESWRLWMRLRRIFSFGGIENFLDDEKSLVYTNIILFNTPKAVQIPAVVFDKYKCQERCMELIDILLPKRILCLGKNNCFRRLPIQEDVELIPAKLQSGVIGENRIPVFGIPHTATHYSKEEMAMLGACLGYLFACTDMSAVTPELIQEKFGDKIKAWRNRKTNNPLPCNGFDLMELAAELVAAGFTRNKCKNGKWFDFDLTDDLVFRISSSSQGQHIGIRANTRAKGADYNADLNGKDRCIRLLSGLDWSAAPTWLGQKSLGNYDGVSGIIADMRMLKEKLAGK